MLVSGAYLYFIFGQYRKRLRIEDALTHQEANVAEILRCADIYPRVLPMLLPLPLVLMWY